MTKCVASYSIAKEDQDKAVLAVYIAEKMFYPSFIANKMDCITFKNGCVVRVAKNLKEDWFIVLH